MDARRGELFTALFRRVPGGIQRVRDTNVCTAEDLAAEIQTFFLHSRSYYNHHGQFLS